MNQAGSNKYKNFLYQISLGLVIGVVIACSPTKFNTAQNVSDVCNISARSCVVSNGFVDVIKDFKVGAGKVDILFVNDNSPSMSNEQKNMAANFGGFIETLDRREIDYKIAIVTTDLAATQKKKFVTYGNGKNFLTNLDTNRVGLFNQAIVREETVKCENDVIRYAINNYGSGWRSDSRYQTAYNQYCPSADERGLYTSSSIIRENSESFLRSDANLSVIIVSDEDERSGQTNSFEANDRYETFNSMMSEVHTEKYWEFNSIVVKDDNCRAVQSNQIVDQQNMSVVGASIGMEYIKLSNSAAKDIDNNPRPRGQILDICQSNYAQHFASMATNIGDTSRRLSLGCDPVAPPVVERVSNPSLPIAHTWDGKQGIVFPRGSEGVPVVVKYRCYKGVQ